MSSVVPLILSEEPITRGLLAKTKISKPGVAVVYADGFGRVAVIDEGRPMTWSEQILSRYRTRYEIDLSDHRRTAQLDSFPLPARGDMYFFNSAVDVGFRVTNPGAVVMRRVTDGLSIVYNYLIDAFRPITRRHEIEDAEGAETEINQAFQQPVALEEGITIYHLRTRLLPDRAAQDYLRSRVASTRALDVGAGEHEVAKAAARQGHELASMDQATQLELAGKEQAARLDAERREYAAMANRPIDLQGLIRAHLSKHPDQTAYALDLLTQHQQALLAHRDINDQRSLDLMRYMIEQGLIQAMDIGSFREQTLGRVQEVVAPPKPALPASASWDAALPGDPDPAFSITPESARTGPIPDPALQQAAQHGLPIYIVVDESPPDPRYYDALNNGIRDLLSGMSEYPDVIGMLRLAVIGFSGSYETLLPLAPVSPESHVRDFASGSGRQLGPVSEHLYNQIKDDVSRRKAGGLKLIRPRVYLLCTGSPDDSPGWEIPYQRLPDRTVHPFAPDIFVLGAGNIDQGAMQSLAAQPGTYGWIASPGLPLADAAARYINFVRKSIITLAESFLSGSSDTSSGQPEGFRPLGSQG